jgi:hypothetical protein
MKKKKFTKYIFVRMPEDLYELILKVSENRGEDVSDFARRAILKELATLNLVSEEQKKFLGVI